MKKYLLILVILVLIACSGERNDLIREIDSWIGKRIVFPSTSLFTAQCNDAIILHDSLREYKILTYWDSIGCVGCKMFLPGWHQLMVEFDSLVKNKVSFLFYSHPANKSDAIHKMRVENFKYPVCFDKDDSLNKSNHISPKLMLQTLLLDSNDIVVAVGNPVANPKIKELYLKIIQGQPIGEEKKTMQTRVAVPETSFTFGDFSWQEVQTHSFEVKNTGNKPLVIQDVTTSCGCITVDFTKEPVQPGGTTIVTVTYKADRAEYFNKTVTVYGNAEQLPVQLHVSGNARE